MNLGDQTDGMETRLSTWRSELRPGDLDAITELHRRVYVPEYGCNEAFLSAVARSVQVAHADGWPAGGGVWLIDGPTGLDGSLALTGEGEGWGQVRWFVLAPRLRGGGLGRRLFADLVAHARALGMTRLKLDTFSELRAAANLYRSHGFEVVSERPREDWAPRPLIYQHYEAELT
jgi:GNAT superfamily N-acetyltransferase